MNPATATIAHAHPLPAIGERVGAGGWILQAAKPYNPRCLSDGFLSVVLCLRFHRYGHDSVTWIHNAQTGGMSHGHYFTLTGEARADFAARGFGGAA
jgi:hypothetical protein